MDIEEYNPKSTLIIKETPIKKAKYSFIDVHNHQFDMPIKDLNKLVKEMDSLNMGFMINLSGFRGLYLKKSLENIKKNAPTRFGLFLNIENFSNRGFRVYWFACYCFTFREWGRSFID